MRLSTGLLALLLKLVFKKQVKLLMLAQITKGGKFQILKDMIYFYYYNNTLDIFKVLN